MTKKLIILLGLTAAAALQSHALDQSKVAELRKQAKEIFGPLPDKMPGAEKDNADLVKLGEKLYFEKRLSQNK